jgi:hypothetical protein
MKLDHQLRVVAQLLHTACDFVIAFTAHATAPGNRDEESLALLATLWSQKMQSRQLTFEAELASHVCAQGLCTRPGLPGHNVRSQNKVVCRGRTGLFLALCVVTPFILCLL